MMKKARGELNGDRKIRAHRKSHKGCGNCRIRSVKCDEGKPACRRCVAYGVSCTYDRAAQAEQLRASMEMVISVEPDAGLPCWVDRGEQLLSRFQVRTAPTVSAGRRLKILQIGVVQLARSHPFLMHAIHALTLMHDRHLGSSASPSPSPSPLSEISTTESHHWHRALASFNARLSQGCRHGEQGALLATAAILGVLSFCHVEARTPGEAWPLAPSSPLGLSWLGISAGKQEVWKLNRTGAPDPVFTALATIHADDMPAASASASASAATLGGLDACDGEPIVPAELARVYHLDNPSESEGVRVRNPYLAPVTRLSRAMGPEFSVYEAVLSFVTFLATMPLDFKCLLENRDPKALLVLVLWYAKICHAGIWWLARRASIEGQAICIYLERYCHIDADMRYLLEYPKAVLRDPMARRV
ncbi:hypothetical protein F4778DRAFT_781689 [Xylariomycetidae sp. FL2044]|nr:hypothetical protein F4778DRAFT_781689 [Xylariomycetidae sp. FL2044]